MISVTAGRRQLSGSLRHAAAAALGSGNGDLPNHVPAGFLQRLGPTTSNTLACNGVVSYRNYHRQQQQQQHHRAHSCGGARRRFSSSLTDPENKGKRQAHVNFDTLGTWDSRIELPLQLQESLRHGKPIPKISVSNIGCATNVGRRATNEDRYRISELVPDLLYCGLFDGHGGSACADFCSQRMEKHITNWINKGELDLATILQTVFAEIDKAFSKSVSFNQSPTEGSTSGTTATVCLLRNSSELVVGHVGDSRALLCRNGEARKLTTDHCPSLKAEKERIEKSGGRVMTNSIGQLLVNGRLAMTRSLGDLELKQYGVSCQPDTRKLEVQHGKDAFLILTTDGINFVMSDQEICDAVNRCHEPTEGANFIVDQALQYASDDNATALVVPFGSWGKFSSSATSHYSFGRNMINSSRYS